MNHASNSFPPVSVVVTVLNESATISYLLDALSHQTVAPTQTIIVDGGSSDGTSDLIKNWQDEHPQFKLTLLHQPGNRSVGRNYGIKAAKTELVAITDAGCEPDPTWLEELLKAHLTSRPASQSPESNPPAVVAGYYYAQPETPFQQAVVPYALVMPERVNPDTFLPATRSLLLAKSTWQKTGGFPEQLSDNEDYAWARSLKQFQIPVTFTSHARVKWFPRQNLQQFATMIFRFARGDAFAQAWRPKVLFIFVRYLLGVLFLGLWPFFPPAAFILLLGLICYLGWAIKKNLRYVPNGWYWLPILQLVSDVMVMSGTLVGLWQRMRYNIVSAHP